MKRLAAATLVLFALGCGDDDSTPAADAAANATDGSVTARNDGSLPGAPTPIDSGLTQPDAGDAGTEPAPLDASTEPTPLDATVDASVDPVIDAGDAEVITVEGDAGTDWILSQQCPASQETNPCYVCEDQHCCQAYANYKANPEALAFFDCFDACTPGAGTSCEEKCAAEHPTGTKDFAARKACVEHFCAASCGSPVNDCLSCSQTNCAAQLVAASANESGFLVQGCNSACGGNTSCAQGCVQEYSVGAGLLILAGECVASKCPQCAPN